MTALAERFIEPGNSTDNPPFELVDERVRGWSFGDTMLPASSDPLTLVGIDDGMDELRCAGVYRSSDMGRWSQDTTICVGADDEPALVRGGEFTFGSFQLSGPMRAAGLAELKPSAGPWFDFSIAPAYPAGDRTVVTGLTGTIAAEWSAEFSKRALIHYLSAIADPAPTGETESAAESTNIDVVTVVGGSGKRGIPEGVITYELCVTSWGVDSTHEVREIVLERIAGLRDTSEDERAPWATWPDERAFEDAVTFVKAWSSSTIRMPDVGLADDGEVNFLWEAADMHVDLGFYGDGTFSYYARDGDRKEYADDDVPAHVGLPKDLLAILKA